MSRAELPPMFQRPLPGHQRLTQFFGLRLQLVFAISAAGIGGGVAGAAYLWTLDGVDDLIGPEQWTVAGQIGVLVIVGLLISLLIRILGRPAGVELLVDNIHVPNGHPNGHASPGARLRSLLPISLLCIGAGGTLGPEAPVVTASGTASHRLALRHSSLERDEVRIVMITGMAAGFAVLFGSPFGAALFALEIPHRRGIRYHEAIVPAVMGSAFGFVASVLAGRHGLEPIWSLRLVDHVTRVDLLWAVLGGALGALIAVAFTLVVRVFEALAGRIPAAARPAIGGLALGLLAWWSPFALTNGEFQIDDVLLATGLTALGVAVVVKLAAAAVSVATGWIGGFIIPLFFVGFSAGLLVSDVISIDHEVVFALGVMAAANIGVTKTPLGSAMVVTEMAGTAVLPTTVIAALVCLILTSPLRLIDAQRERVDAYREEDDLSES